MTRSQTKHLIMAKLFGHVIPAPLWLKRRMEALRALPPPTLEEVRQSFAASAEHSWRHRHDGLMTRDSEGREVMR